MPSVTSLRAGLVAVGTVLGTLGAVRRDAYLMTLALCFVACGVVGDGRE